MCMRMICFTYNNKLRIYLFAPRVLRVVESIRNRTRSHRQGNRWVKKCFEDRSEDIGEDGGEDGYNVSEWGWRKVGGGVATNGICTVSFHSGCSYNAHVAG